MTNTKKNSKTKKVENNTEWLDKIINQLTNKLQQSLSLFKKKLKMFQLKVPLKKFIIQNQICCF